MNLVGIISEEPTDDEPGKRGAPSSDPRPHYCLHAASWYDGEMLHCSGRTLAARMRTSTFYALIIFLASCSSSKNDDDGVGGSLAGGGNKVGSGTMGTTNSGGAGGSPNFGSPPLEVNSVLLPQINPAWPLGEWDGHIYGPQIILECNTGQQAYTQVYDVTIAAGAGLDFSAKTRNISGSPVVPVGS